MNEKSWELTMGFYPGILNRDKKLFTFRINTTCVCILPFVDVCLEIFED